MGNAVSAVSADSAQKKRWEWHYVNGQFVPVPVTVKK